MVEALGRNLATRLLAFVAALTLWLVVDYDERAAERARRQANAVERIIQVPVEVVGLPEGLEVVGLPGGVDVRLRGAATSLDKAESTARAVLKLAGLGAGSHMVRVVTKAPGGVEVLGVDPDSLLVNLERLERRTFAVKVAIVGSPSRGWSVGNATVEPLTATVRATSSKMARIRQLVAFVDVGGNTEDIAARVPVVAVDAESRTVTEVAVEPASVLVSVPVSKAWRILQAPVVPQLVGEPAAGFEVKSVRVLPRVVPVVVPSDLAGPNSTPQATTSPVDIGGAFETVQAQPDALAPEGASLVEADKVAVTVVIGPVAAETPEGEDKTR